MGRLKYEYYVLRHRGSTRSDGYDAMPTPYVVTTYNEGLSDLRYYRREYPNDVFTLARENIKRDTENKVVFQGEREFVNK